MAQSAIFSSRFETDNQLIRHTKCAVLNVHRFKMGAVVGNKVASRIPNGVSFQIVTTLREPLHRRIKMSCHSLLLWSERMRRGTKGATHFNSSMV